LCSFTIYALHAWFRPFSCRKWQARDKEEVDELKSVRLSVLSTLKRTQCREQLHVRYWYLPARFPDSESTLKHPLVRLSVLVPVANLHVRFQHACGSLIKLSIGTLKWPIVRLSVHNVESSDLYADCTLPTRSSKLHQMRVDKAHVAVPNWTKEDFQGARLSNPCTLKRAGTNLAHVNSFLFSFHTIITLFLIFFWFLERD